MTEFDREKPLFDATLPVRMRTRTKLPGGRGDFVDEEIVRLLAVRILMGARANSGSNGPVSGSNSNAGSGPGSMRVLHVEITDEAEPFFLHTLDVGEDDFHELKRDQALLVDFDAFPRKFIELLECCVAANALGDGSSSGGSGGDSGSNSSAPSARKPQQQPLTPGSPSTAAAAAGGSNARSSDGDPPSPMQAGHGDRHGDAPKFVARLDMTGAATPVVGGGSWSGSGGGFRSGGSNSSQGGRAGSSSSSAGSSALFSVVETNPFKQLTHLALAVKAGDDSSIKAYLAGRLRHTLSKGSRLASDLATSESALCEERRARAEAQGELGALHQQRAQELREVAAGHAAELAQRREEAARDREELTSRLEGARQAAHGQLEESLKLVRQRCDGAEEKAAELSELRYRLEAEVRDLRAKSGGLEGSHGAAVADLSETRTALRVAEGKVTSLEAKVQRSEVTHAALMQQVEDKQALLEQQGHLGVAEEAAKSSAAADLERHKQLVGALQDRLRQSAAEIGKGNGIIAKLQDDLRKAKDRSKQKSECLREQEKALEEGRRACSDAEALAHSRALDLGRATESRSRAEAELSEARRRLEESAGLLESNQQTIAWLNKELNASAAQFGTASTLPPPSTAPMSFEQPSPYSTSSSSYMATATPEMMAGGGMERPSSSLAGVAPISDPAGRGGATSFSAVRPSPAYNTSTTTAYAAEERTSEAKGDDGAKRTPVFGSRIVFGGGGGGGGSGGEDVDFRGGDLDELLHAGTSAFAASASSSSSSSSGGSSEYVADQYSSTRPGGGGGGGGGGFSGGSENPGRGMAAEGVLDEYTRPVVGSFRNTATTSMDNTPTTHQHHNQQQQHNRQQQQQQQQPRFDHHYGDMQQGSFSAPRLTEGHVDLSVSFGRSTAHQDGDQHAWRSNTNGKHPASASRSPRKPFGAVNQQQPTDEAPRHHSRD